MRLPLTRSIWAIAAAATGPISLDQTMCHPDWIGASAAYCCRADLSRAIARDTDGAATLSYSLTNTVSSVDKFYTWELKNSQLK